MKVSFSSDQNLYLRFSSSQAAVSDYKLIIDDNVIYEISPDAVLLRRFELGEGHLAGGVECVHDRKFLLFEHGEGKLVPLVGNPSLHRGLTEKK